MPPPPGMITVWNMFIFTLYRPQLGWVSTQSGKNIDYKKLNSDFGEMKRNLQQVMNCMCQHLPTITGFDVGMHEWDSINN